jgi:hypothetical protein
MCNCGKEKLVGLSKRVRLGSEFELSQASFNLIIDVTKL